MVVSISAFLTDDHRRLEALLRAAKATETVDYPPYDAFRRGLLRHIAMEEKILLPAARRARSGEPLPMAKQIRADHSALAALLVPTPTPDLLERIDSILVEHNPLEEGPGGLYEACDRLLEARRDEILERLAAQPKVPVAAHFDGPRAEEQIARLLQARSARKSGAGGD